MANPIPSNGATPTTPQPPANPTQPNADPLAAREAQLKAREEAMNKRESTWKSEAKKAADAKGGLGEKLKKLSEYERRENLAKLNPPEYLKSLYGDKWHDLINTTAVHGVPPADLIMAELSKFNEKMDERFAALEAKSKEGQTAAQQQAITEARGELNYRCSDFMEQSGKDYPVFESLKALGGSTDDVDVARILAQRIETEFNRPVKPGEKPRKLLTPKEAADLLEGELLQIVDKAATADKYKSRLQEKMKPASVAASGRNGGAPQGSTGRTLNNALTASTPSGKPTHRTEKERLEAATAAFNAARSR